MSQTDSPANPSTTDPTTAPPPVLAGKEIVLGVCGGIAVYKVADLVSKMVQRGAGVTVCMTDAAKEFVTPLTFQALSGRPVHSNTFEVIDARDTQHISLTERADLMIMAPATANLLAKVSHGICDDLLSLMVCAAACPVAFAPAMNSRMWDNPVTQENVNKLKGLGYPFIGPDAGWLACRNVGSGRMSEPAAILEEIVRLVNANPKQR